MNENEELFKNCYILTLLILHMIENDEMKIENKKKKRNNIFCEKINSD